MGGRDTPADTPPAPPGNTPPAAPGNTPPAASGNAPGLEASLIRFIHVLRHLGVPVNPAETVDALAALGLIDLGDRGEVKTALKATLVKDESQTPFFDRAFDLFFAPPEVRQAQLDAHRRALEGPAEARRKAQAELVFQGEPIKLTPEQIETYSRLGEIQQARLREFLAETSAGNNVDQGFTPLIESIVRGHLERLRAHLDLERRPHPDLTGDEELDTVIEGTLAGDTEAGSGALMRVDMKDIDEADLPRATRLIRRLAARLATRLSRRYRETRKRRRPNMRRTIRSNIRHGGVLFDLRFRERKVSRPRLLLICDVSGSMARYTGFILEFIFGLKAAVRGVEAFVFSEELERITDRITGDSTVHRPRAAGPAPRGAGPSPAGTSSPSSATGLPSSATDPPPSGTSPPTEALLDGIRDRLTEAFMEAAAPPRRGGRPEDRARAAECPRRPAAGGLPGAAGAPSRQFLSSAREVIDESRVWGRGTDLGTALGQLWGDYGRYITHDTVVIVVSDTKTLGAEKAAGILARLRPRVRQILWLNTLPREEWKSQKTVRLFARYSAMYECQTLAHLEKILRVGVGRHIRRA